MKKVAIIGGGAAGTTAALKLKEFGIKPIIFDKEDRAGGTLFLLDKQFSNDACGYCQVFSRTSPPTEEVCLKREIPADIDVTLMSKVTKIEEKNGRVYVAYENTHYVDENKCIACGVCEEVCPETYTDSINRLKKKKAISRTSAFSSPPLYKINMDVCTKCGLCVEKCPTKAIDLERQPETYEEDFDGCIVATGFEPSSLQDLSAYHPEADNVITSLELERLISEEGPTKGRLLTKKGERPKNIAFIFCAGSRDRTHQWCSSACCMYGVKETRLLKELYPDINITHFYMDRRFGKRDYYSYYLKIKNDIREIKNRPARITPLSDKKLSIKYENENSFIEDIFDMVVLVLGQEPNNNIQVNGSNKIISAGSYIEPMDLPETIISAESAAYKLVKTLKADDKLETQNSKEGNVIWINIIPYGFEKHELELNIPALHTELLPYEELKESVLNFIKKHNANKVLFTAPYRFGIERNIVKILKEINLGKNDYLFVNTTDISYTTVKGALNKLIQRKNVDVDAIVNDYPILVIGAGLAGLSIASHYIKFNKKVYLIEKKENPFEKRNYPYKSIEGVDIEKVFKTLREEIENAENVTFIKGKELQKLEGAVGNYTVDWGEGERKVSLIYIATGGKEYTPEKDEFGWGQKYVITQRQLEENLKKGTYPEDAIIFIQCVGSRNEKNPYCSHVCCRSAIKNALSIKAKLPEKDIYILYRDIFTPGNSEKYYTEAREKGIVFVPYSLTNPPIVSNNEVDVYDTILNANIKLKGTVVLSTGIVANSNKELSQLVNIKTSFGFFTEVNVKYRPISTEREGIFVVGLASGPKRALSILKEAESAVLEGLSLLKAKEPEYYVSNTNIRKCVLCGICVDSCPSHIRFLDREAGYARVVTSLCQGCGICAQACPSEAAYIVNENKLSMFEIINEYF